MTVASGRWSLGGMQEDFSTIIDEVKQAPIGSNNDGALTTHSDSDSDRSMCRDFDVLLYLCLRYFLILMNFSIFEKSTPLAKIYHK